MKLSHIVTLFTAAGVLAWSVPAGAGIIVTVGKQGAEASEANDHLDDCPVAANSLTNTSGEDSKGGSDWTHSAKGNSQPDAKKGGLSDSDGPPDGMDCRSIGGGIELCQPVGAAGGPGGASAVGGEGQDADGIEVMGCSSGTSGGSLAWLALGLLGLFGLRRRSVA